jgi:hydrogenase maturation protein HypF
VGDLANYETLQSFTDGIAHHERLFSVTPRRIGCDLHPEYLSTKYARERAECASSMATATIQHHHAHLAACLAEHGEEGPTIGVIFDGTGYGTDGTIWGGELLVGDLTRFDRVGHLRPVRLPGGEAAVHEPWRMACSWLCASLADAVPEIPPTLVMHVREREWRAVAQMARSGMASPYTTSIGRLLDALSALCGVRSVTLYEGQAATELEMIADEQERGSYELPVIEAVGQISIDARPFVRQVLHDVKAQMAIPTIAGRIHNSIAVAASRACEIIAGRSGIRTVVLSGGVFQNVLLLERTATRLLANDLRVLIPERVPPNDGGVAFGQAAIAAARTSVPTPAMIIQ